MTSTHVVAVSTASALALAALLCGACGGSPSAPAPPPATTPPPASPTPAPVNIVGTWNGAALDSQGATSVSWTLAVDGTAVSGKVVTNAINPLDGSCGSCHRNKSGTVKGTYASGTLDLTMFFAAGADGDPTPACSATITLSAPPSSIGTEHMSGAYSGSDTCEGPFLNGAMQLDRQR